MANVVIVGAQWGDEGKGKVVDLLGGDIAYVVRFQGGNNAGHTVIIGDKKYALHLVPSGILREKTTCLIGNGVVLDPMVFLQEVDKLAGQGIDVSPRRLKISAKTHLIMPYHVSLDQAREAALQPDKKIGTTGRGIGPCYEDKVARVGIRAGDLALDDDELRHKITLALREKNILFANLYEKAPLDVEEMLAHAKSLAARINPYVEDISRLVDAACNAGEHVLFEGAQGVHLDVDHGTYPFVTSSNTVAGAAAAGSGIGPMRFDRIIGIAKAYVTRVGSGPFPTELQDDIGEFLREKGGEYGVTTGRPRRCGWADAPLLRTSVRLNSLTDIALTKLDVFSGLDELKICTAYDVDGTLYDSVPACNKAFARAKPVYETMPGWNASLDGCTSWESLPTEAKNFVLRLEALVQVPMSMVSVGPERNQTIAR